MNTPIARTIERSTRFAIVAASALLTILSDATPARGQCAPAQQARLSASDASTTDNLGIGVAVDGDTALAGAWDDGQPGANFAGSAYVFTRTSGVWTQQQKLIASDPADSDFFGFAVAVEGDTAAIGAYADDQPGIANAGAVYIFTRTLGVWSQQQKLIASDPAAFNHFGFSVDLSGDTVVIGTPSGEAPGVTDAGSAYVFTRSGTVWTQQQKISASDAAANDNFATSVAVFGDTAVIGSYLDDHPGGTDAGSIYVFTRAGAVWTQQQKLTSSDAANNDNFGITVALSDNSAMVGAWSDDHTGGNDAGSAYVFSRNGTNWTQQAKLIAADPAPADFFGFSVALSGDIAVIGAYGDNNAGGSDAGSAYVFTRAGNWSQSAKLTASDAASTDFFGRSVALSGDTALAGAHLDDHAGGTDAGSAYAFALGCDNDGDGIINANDACPNNAAGLEVDCFGRPRLDANGDCLVNVLDVPPIAGELVNQ